MLSSDKSEYLLVNGNTDNGMKEVPSVSFLSCVVAQFIEELGIPVAHFFCASQKCNTDLEPLTGPWDILRQLTSQAISYCKEKWIEDAEYKDLDNINGLLNFLGKIMAKQPRNQTFFFVVDTISVYCTDRWIKETCTVVQGLLELAESSNVIVKVLITTAKIAAEMQGMFTEECILCVDWEMLHAQGLRFGQAGESLTLH